MTDRDNFAAAALTGLLGGRLGPYSCSENVSYATLAYSLADAMLRERGNHSEKPNSSTNHDAVPEAIAKSCDDCGPQATPELGNHVLAPPQDGTGDTQGPVAWAVMANDWFHDVRLSEDGAEWYSSYLNNKAGKGKCRVVPLYRQPQPTLTDEEREAIEAAIERFKDWVNGFDDPDRAATLRGLLARLGGER